jgi:hypothetical protein
MINLLYGAAALGLLWWLSRQFATANPATLAKRLKQAGGAACLLLAMLLAARGRFDMAALFGGIAAWLFGWSGFGSFRGFGRPSAPSPGRVSRVRSAMLEMELDHDTGAMDGLVLAGAFAGRRLNGLPDASVVVLFEECARVDPDGVRLLEPYLDRRLPGWRQHAQGHGDPGPRREAKAAAMSEEEAYQVLGLEPGASEEEIRRAHRTLMKRLHPDQGGSTYLAARVNQAKDVLLSRHR